MTSTDSTRIAHAIARATGRRTRVLEKRAPWWPAFAVAALVFVWFWVLSQPVGGGW